MPQTYQVIVESEPKPAEMGMVIKGLGAYNASKADGEMPNYLFITVRGEDGSIEGGLVGATYLGWLQVQAVWISDALRGLGYGTALMQEAENEAIRRGCPRVFLETLSFQALPFYEKRGYVVFSRLADLPPGGARYALTKQLDRR
ncbi:GNAT family N-acetyltransferase [Undibacterium sp.]|uniref:GNAT family N-acetyltransferase n=1 Tax=Undibacterium sp. TaxID=1914977 RepID=UPI002BB67B07|nr:GNAT family N-acetyltransferase [Undibacterium sp.]HTD07147.1 GNAT family N-acetyltransferase [Undibacterium sp.]